MGVFLILLALFDFLVEIFTTNPPSSFTLTDALPIKINVKEPIEIIEVSKNIVADTPKIPVQKPSLIRQMLVSFPNGQFSRQWVNDPLSIRHSKFIAKPSTLVSELYLHKPAETMSKSTEPSTLVSELYLHKPAETMFKSTKLKPSMVSNLEIPNFGINYSSLNITYITPSQCLDLDTECFNTVDNEFQAWKVQNDADQKQKIENTIADETESSDDSYEIVINRTQEIRDIVYEYSNFYSTDQILNYLGISNISEIPANLLDPNHFYTLPPNLNGDSPVITSPAQYQGVREALTRLALEADYYTLVNDSKMLESTLTYANKLKNTLIVGKEFAPDNYF